jgi:hypothetical protein
MSAYVSICQHTSLKRCVELIELNIVRLWGGKSKACQLSAASKACRELVRNLPLRKLAISK